MLNETNTRLGHGDYAVEQAPEAPGALAHMERRLGEIVRILSHTVETSESLRTRLLGPEPIEVAAGPGANNSKGPPGQLFQLDRQFDEVESLARRARNAAVRLQEGL